MLLLGSGGRLLVSADRVRFKQPGEYPLTTEKTKCFLWFCTACSSRNSLDSIGLEEANLAVWTFSIRWTQSGSRGEEA